MKTKTGGGGKIDSIYFKKIVKGSDWPIAYNL